MADEVDGATLTSEQLVAAGITEEDLLGCIQLVGLLAISQGPLEIAAVEAEIPSVNLARVVPICTEYGWIADMPDDGLSGAPPAESAIRLSAVLTAILETPLESLDRFVYIKSSRRIVRDFLEVLLGEVKIAPKQIGSFERNLANSRKSHGSDESKLNLWPTVVIKNWPGSGGADCTVEDLSVAGHDMGLTAARTRSSLVVMRKLGWVRQLSSREGRAYQLTASGNEMFDHVSIGGVALTVPMFLRSDEISGLRNLAEQRPRDVSAKVRKTLERLGFSQNGELTEVGLDLCNSLRQDPTTNCGPWIRIPDLTQKARQKQGSRTSVVAKRTIGPKNGVPR